MADDDEVEAFTPDLGQPACTAGHFRPDLTSTPGSDWNVSVIEVFVQHFMTSNPTVDADAVEKAFKRHLKYLCGRYKEALSGKTAQDLKKKNVRRSSRQREVSVDDIVVRTYTYARILSFGRDDSQSLCSILS